MVVGWSLDGLCVRAGAFEVGPVDLDLPPGASVAVVGPSGAGKTTLLRGLAGVAPVTGGRVLRGGEDVTRLPPEHRRIGYVPQGLGLLPHRSVERNVAYPLELRGASPTPTVGRLLARFGLDRLAARRPFGLSTGEQQRVAMARALAARPDLLAWDEPLAGLDVVARDDLLHLLADVQRTDHLPILLVTHDPVAAFSVADRLLLLDAGHVVHAGPVLPAAHEPADTFVARFVGFENVYAPHELHRADAGTLARWLGERAGPKGVAFRASDARWTDDGTPASFRAVVRRISPGAGGLHVLAESDGLWVRLGALPPNVHARPGTSVRFDLEPAAVHALPHASREPEGG